MQYAALVLVVVVVAVIAIMSTNRGVDKIQSSFEELTDEQYAILRDSVVEVDEDGPEGHAWDQVGLVSSIKPHGTSVTVRVMWFNKVIHNDSYGQVAIAQIIMPRRDVKERGLQEGDYVSLHMDTAKGASINFS